MPPYSISSPPEKAAYIISLLNASANAPYIGEPISTLEHSLQCAHLAATSDPTPDDETIVAALLHDIGQFIPEDELVDVLGSSVEIEDMTSSPSNGSESGHEGITGSVGRVGHDELGARYLSALGFSDKISKLVGSHVAAKRYLCAIDPRYHDALSAASKKSLEFQGGPMAGKEKQEFEDDECSIDMCRVRRWDDAAKVVDLEVPRPEAYQSMIERALAVQ
jgi:putative nucleotidyltransferase with HDIG domain